ncbi:copper chaperone PCu(A)C [Nocardioides sp. zg-579]|uniref:Copper chaperone PCu(A)C n=1 Tax=Nocardioides marmotae TaxID=2663857 RepID=A0A6I3J3A5_9ACTN|nr:copper chaperone PCu(A)C [Nocardioides marmotae]MCR6031457.1 copper chaperone PCu(A)C [Gordonia jinghuaiqii]MTB95096.1 copper chaperone PCu(A)C [Nocardioides marmotae]QKE02412.1 copper chaperone PCu(A)C [Nocardioides marmotae]
MHSSTTRSSTPAPARPARRRRAALGALALAGALALTACGEDAEPSASTSESTSASTSEGAEVVVTDPWVRATDGAEDTSMTAAFMDLANDGDEDVTLVSASTDVAGMVELHEIANVDGKPVMQEAAGGIELGAGGGQLLQPGGYHVMLMDLAGELAAGEEVDLTLEFSDGSTVEVTAPVKAFTEEEGHYHDHGSHDHGSSDEGDGHSQ